MTGVLYPLPLLLIWCPNLFIVAHPTACIVTLSNPPHLELSVDILLADCWPLVLTLLCSSFHCPCSSIAIVPPPTSFVACLSAAITATNHSTIVVRWFNMHQSKAKSGCCKKWNLFWGVLCLILALSGAGVSVLYFIQGDGIGILPKLWWNTHPRQIIMIVSNYLFWSVAISTASGVAPSNPSTLSTLMSSMPS